MKNKIPTLFLTTALALTLAGAAYAEEPAASALPAGAEPAPASDAQQEETPPAFYPTTVELRQDADQMLVVKRYTVPADTPVSELEESGVTRMGRDYALWAVSENRDTTKIEEVDLYKTLDVAVPSNIPEEAIASLQHDLVYDQDGYYGTLHLVDVVCTDEMREDGTYPASASYTGTVARETEGDLSVELIYAPVEADPVETVAQPPVPTTAVLVGGMALLAGVGSVGYALGKKKRAPAAPVHRAEPEERRKVYVPANDIVVGAHEEDDDD